MFNTIFFGALWALAGFAGWFLKVKYKSGGKATSYDATMFVPSLIVGPLNLVFAIMYL